MSREKVVSQSINAKKLMIKTTYTSSDTWDEVKETIEQKFETESEFKTAVFEWINDYFMGTVVYGRRSTFIKRLIWCFDNGYIKQRQTSNGRDYYFGFDTANDRNKVYRVISGQEKVQIHEYMIVGIDDVKLKINPRTYRLDYEKGTTFISKSDAERWLKNHKIWTENYGLHIERTK